MSRRQCACLLAHRSMCTTTHNSITPFTVALHAPDGNFIPTRCSFLGSLKRPPDVQPNDFRFTVRDLFVGTAMSPNSAITFLNYFSYLARNGIPDGPEEIVTFERLGWRKGETPWQWEGNKKPLCATAASSHRCWWGPGSQAPPAPGAPTGPAPAAQSWWSARCWPHARKHQSRAGARAGNQMQRARRTQYNKTI